MSDNATPSISDLLYANLDKTPEQLAASVQPASPAPAVPANAKLSADPDDTAGQDPANPVPDEEPDEIQPDSEVTMPADPAPAEAAPVVEPTPAPAPAPQPTINVEEEFKAIQDQYNSVIQEITQTETQLNELNSQLEALETSEEGLNEFTPEKRKLTMDCARLEGRLESLRSREQDSYEGGNKESIDKAVLAYPELADDNHPATIAVKAFLAEFPETWNKSPTAVADVSTKIAQKMREQTKATPAAQPKPAPGPVPATRPVSGAAMASAASAAQPAPGRPVTPDLATQVAQAASEGSLKGLFDKVLGGNQNASIIRMS